MVEHAASEPQPPRTTRIATPANFVSALRLLMAFALPLPLVEPWRLHLLIAGAISDWLDGFVATITRSRSTLGQLLDPIADKALFLSALLTLALSGEITWLQAGLVMLRDFAVLLVALTATFRG